MSLTEVVLVQQDVVVRGSAGALDARVRQQEEVILRGVGDPAVHDCNPTPTINPKQQTVISMPCPQVCSTGRFGVQCTGSRCLSTSRRAGGTGLHPRGFYR